MRRACLFMFRHPVVGRSAAGRMLPARLVALPAVLPAVLPVVVLPTVLFIAALLLACGPAHADDAQAPRAEGPYFQLPGGDPSIDALPLKATQVSAQIAGVIADVTVTQHYRNEGRRAIEAVYVFPGATGSAVHAMQVKLGDRVLTAKIDEKQRARIRHDTAKREGKTSALLEQHRPNVFQMSVANILPGEEVQVTLRYTELIAPDAGRYAWVYPTVVGPRYHRASTDGGSRAFAATAQLKQGAPSNASFELQVSFASPLPVTALRSPSHEIHIAGEGDRQAEVTLNDPAPQGDRDFILEYRLAGERTATGLTLYRGKGGKADQNDDPKGDNENFFLAIVEPPQAIAPAMINPREYVFVVDISGSMQGQPLATAKTLLRNLIGGLRPTDTFNVMLFSGSSQMLSAQSVLANPANVERAIRIIDRAQGGGSTEIVPALRRIAALPKAADLARTVIVVTDGYVTVESEVFALIRKHLDRSNVFAFGIGGAVNRHLIEGIARAGQGEAFIVTKPEHAAAQAERLRKMIDAPVLTHVRARFEGLDVFDVEPAVLPDVLGGRPVVLHGKWRGEPRGTLVIEGQAANGAFRDVVPVAAPDAQAVALRHLWARHRIQQLSDQEALDGGSRLREEITALGLRHSLLTQYTSFIAIDEVVRSEEPANTVNVPLPLPQGVSNAAVGESVGAAVPSTPEPGAWLAAVVALGLIGVSIGRPGRA